VIYGNNTIVTLNNDKGGLFYFMTKFKEKVSYLQGLTKGLNVNEHSAEGKLLMNIVDVLDDLAQEFDNFYLAQQDLEEYVETIDEDLTDLEEEVYDPEDDTSEDFVEVECPTCHETVTFEAGVLNDEEEVEVTCPTCGSVVYDSELDIETEDSEDYSKSHISMHPGI
jgi:ribosomal protein S27E